MPPGLNQIGEKSWQWGKKKSEETRAKMAASHYSVSIEVKDLQEETTEKYSSLAAAGRALNCAPGSLLTNLKSKRQLPFRGRYELKRIE